MRNPERKSFADLLEFRAYARDTARLVYYYVFRGVPDRRMLDALAGRGPDEALVLLDIEEDRGFLSGTDVTVDIEPSGQFVTRKMSERLGLGTWSRGTPVNFAAEPNEVEDLVAHARRFAFPPARAGAARAGTHAEA